MTTITVPLTEELSHLIDELLKRGIGANKADLIRQALRKFGEDQAVADVLEAHKEPRLKGSLRDLAKAL